MLNSIFNPDNFFFRWCSKIFDIVVLSLLWTLLCIPIITIGPATTALYYTVAKCVRRGEDAPYANFFRSFRQNFKVSAIAGVILTVATLVFLWTFSALGVLASEGNRMAQLFHTSYKILALLAAGYVSFLFPILSRFTLKPGKLFLTTFQMSIRHLPSAVIVGLLCMQVGQLTVWYLFPFFFSPALTMLIASLFIERVLKKYTPAPEVPEKHRFEEDVETPWYLK